MVFSLSHYCNGVLQTNYQARGRSSLPERPSTVLNPVSLCVWLWCYQITQHRRRQSCVVDLGSASCFPFPPVSSRALSWEMPEQKFLFLLELVDVMLNLQPLGGCFRSSSTFWGAVGGPAVLGEDTIHRAAFHRVESMAGADFHLSSVAR